MVFHGVNRGSTAQILYEEWARHSYLKGIPDYDNTIADMAAASMPETG